MKPTEGEVKKILRKIAGLKSTVGNMPYAQTYAKVSEDMYGETLRVQTLYVLSNLQHWRGKEAREAKIVLKRFTKL